MHTGKAWPVGGWKEGNVSAFLPHPLVTGIHIHTDPSLIFFVPHLPPPIYPPSSIPPPFARLRLPPCRMDRVVNDVLLPTLLSIPLTPVIYPSLASQPAGWCIWSQSTTWNYPPSYLPLVSSTPPNVYPSHPSCARALHLNLQGGRYGASQRRGTQPLFLELMLRGWMWTSHVALRSSSTCRCCRFERSTSRDGSGAGELVSLTNDTALRLAG